ncbi:S-layer homology domain-containing protein [Desulforudis sp. DRI-14]
MWKRTAVVLTLCVMLILTLAVGTAFAGVITSILVDGDSTPPYVSASNTITIEVYTTSDGDVKVGSVVTFIYGSTEPEIKVPGVTASKPSSTKCVVDNYPLKPGVNSITITAKVDGVSETKKLTVTFPNAPTEGATFSVGDITTQTKVTAFSGNIILDLGKGNYLVNFGSLAGDQSLVIRVDDLDLPKSYSPSGFVCISPVYEIDSNGNTLGAPAKLTVKYTGIGAEPDRITVFRSDNYDFSNSTDINLGGLVNKTARTVTIPLEGTVDGYYAVFISVVGAQNYTDLPADGWYYHPVSALFAKGVMKPANSSPGNNPWGYLGVGGSDTFGLSSSLNICRGEFAYIIVKALGLPLIDVSTSTFPDVDSGLSGEYEDAIETAARNGLIAGLPNGNFGWDATLTREQAAAIIARATRLTLVTDEQAVDAVLQTAFADGADKDVSDGTGISIWARPSVLACYKAGYIGGVPSAGGSVEFQGGASLTRAQAASLIHKMMQKMKLL